MSYQRGTPDPNAGFLERLRFKVGEFFARQVVPPETRYIHDGIAIQYALETSDEAYVAH
jgi:5-hydroxyisourate hydrolase-like protein (transthyretin family)